MIRACVQWKHLSASAFPSVSTAIGEHPSKLNVIACSSCNVLDTPSGCTFRRKQPYYSSLISDGAAHGSTKPAKAVNQLARSSYSTNLEVTRHTYCPRATKPAERYFSRLGRQATYSIDILFARKRSCRFRYATGTARLRSQETTYIDCRERLLPARLSGDASCKAIF
jgi:hypothetical protein